jgi:hypothetical protein
MVAVAFIHPDLEMRPLQVLLVQMQLPLYPPVPLSGRQVHCDRFHVMVVGVTEAVNVTESGPAMLRGAAVTVSLGGVTVMLTDWGAETPFTVANTVIVPDRVKGFRQVRVGDPPL